MEANDLIREAGNCLELMVQKVNQRRPSSYSDSGSSGSSVMSSPPPIQSPTSENRGLFGDRTPPTPRNVQHEQRPVTPLPPSIWYSDARDVPTTPTTPSGGAFPVIQPSPPASNAPISHAPQATYQLTSDVPITEEKQARSKETVPMGDER